jgi:hypothetical protein
MRPALRSEVRHVTDSARLLLKKNKHSMFETRTAPRTLQLFAQLRERGAKGNHMYNHRSIHLPTTQSLDACRLSNGI